MQNKQGSVLSTELILTTALRLAEQAGGLDKLSLRQVGKDLAVDPTAIYRYFRSKDELVATMVDRIVTEMLPAEEELTGDWRSRLTALAEHARRVFTAYPSLTIVVASLHTTMNIDTAVSTRQLEIGYAALTEAGLSDYDVVHFYDGLFTFILGFGFVDASFGANPDEGRAALRDRYAELATQRFPNLSRVAAIAHPNTDAVFRFILASYLDTIERYAATTKRTTDQGAPLV